MHLRNHPRSHLLRSRSYALEVTPQELRIQRHCILKYLKLHLEVGLVGLSSSGCKCTLARLARVGQTCQSLIRWQFLTIWPITLNFFSNYHNCLLVRCFHLRGLRSSHHHYSYRTAHPAFSALSWEDQLAQLSFSSDYLRVRWRKGDSSHFEKKGRFAFFLRSQA